MIWYKENCDDVIVSTRIRLARNIGNYPFPAMLSEKGRENVTEEVKDAVLNSNSTLSKEFTFLDMKTLSLAEKRKLCEKHLISLDMENNQSGSCLINRDETMSIMLMEEDHLRIQIILGGFKLKEAWETASRVDDVIEERVNYAFSEEFGYLTACPSNTGTGMRASVMMHLPALTMTNNIDKIISSASALGLTVRGLYGEGSKAYGNLYQLSNQVTLGLTEAEIVENVENIAEQIKKYELEVRKNLEGNEDLADKLCRSYGVIKYARKITSKEAKSLISDVILAKNMGIIDVKDTPLMELMVECEPALLMENGDMSAEERDKKRAEMLRENV